MGNKSRYGYPSARSTPKNHDFTTPRNARRLKNADHGMTFAQRMAREAAVAAYRAANPRRAA